MCFLFTLRLSSLVGLNVFVPMSHYREAIAYMLFSCLLYFQQLVFSKVSVLKEIAMNYILQLIYIILLISFC